MGVAANIQGSPGHGDGGEGGPVELVDREPAEYLARRNHRRHTLLAQEVDPPVGPPLALVAAFGEQEESSIACPMPATDLTSKTPGME